MEKNTLGAVILAGGFGSRLAPLTDSCPKPLLKVLNRSVLSIAIEKLQAVQVSDIAVSCHCKGKLVAEHIKDMQRVRTVYERVPMGTAGGAKMCVSDSCDDIIVLSGDGIFDFDVQKIVDYHMQNSADVTIVTTKKENPTQLGVVVSDDLGNVSEIIEKPSWNQVVSDVVNTGIYVIKRRVFDEIPDNIPYDFSGDLFPKLLKSGYIIKTLTLNDYWCDMGTPSDYLQCNIDGCMGKIKSLACFEDDMKKLRYVGIRAEDRVLLGEGAVIGSNVVIERGVVAGKNCSVEKNCIICKSVFGNNVKIGEGCGIYETIIGNDVTVGANCIISEGCVIADGITIKEGTVLKKNTLINVNGQHSIRVSENKGGMIFEQDGIAVLKDENQQETARRFGYSLVAAVKKTEKYPVKIGAIISDCEKNVFDGFVKGCTDAGAELFQYMDADRYMTKFASVVFPCDVTVCLSKFGNNTKIELTDENMQSLDDLTERKIIKIYNAVVCDDNGKNKENGNKVTVQNINRIYSLYISKALKMMLGNLPSLNCELVFENSACLREKMLRTALEKFYSNADDVEKISVTLDDNGFEIKSKTKSYDLNHIVAAVCLNSDVLGIDKVYTDENTPDAVKYLMARKGICFENLTYAEKRNVRINEMSSLICFEEGFCLCALACILSLKKTSLDELMNTLPKFEVYTDIYIGSQNRAETMARLCRMYEMGERKSRGVTVKMSGGSVTVIPERIKGFKVVSESTSMETAKELCYRIERAVLKEN